MRELMAKTVLILQNKLMTQKQTPLTNAFIESLKLKMGQLRIKQTTVARLTGKTKQEVWAWLTSRKRNPNSEMTLKLLELDRKDFKE